jgi:hypothetical protein
MINPVASMAGNNVECVNVIKFLSCMIGCKLNWSWHVSRVCQTLCQGTALLKANYFIAPQYVERMIYYAFIYPYLIYCVAIWGSAANCYTNKVIVLQKRVAV